MKKILITGGACAGKTSVLNTIRNYLEDSKYEFQIFEEVPTKLISGGITSEKIGKMEFVELIIKNQIANERNCQGKEIIIFDGSPIDSMKFITREEFEKFARKYNTSFNKIINGYDGIIFLETVAKKFPELYSNENNLARLTDVDAAVTRNDKLFQIYNENLNVYLIKPEKNMEIKNNNVINTIKKILSEE